MWDLQVHVPDFIMRLYFIMLFVSMLLLFIYWEVEWVHVKERVNHILHVWQLAGSLLHVHCKCCNKSDNTFVYVHFDKHNHFQQGDFIFKILLIAYTCKKYVCCVYENHFVLSLSHVYFFFNKWIENFIVKICNLDWDYRETSTNIYQLQGIVFYNSFVYG